jgi:hypothetical protein
MQFLRALWGVVATVAPCEVCNAIVHKPRHQRCDILLSCFLTVTLYFFVYLLRISLIVQCEFDSSVQMEE